MRLFFSVFFFSFSSILFASDTFNSDKYTPENYIQFMKNHGQWKNKAVLYKGNYKGTHVRFLENGISYAVSRVVEDELDKKDKHITGRLEARKKEKREALVWNQYFKNMNPNTQIIEKGYSDSKTNYLIGNDKSKWVRNAAQYNQLMYENIYDNIDLDYYSVDQRIKYDYVVKPGGDISDIQVEYEGIEKLSINQKGQLVIQTTWGETIDQKPYSYQTINGKQKKVEVEYEIINKNTFGFKAMQKYNMNQTLIIDPYSLVWSTLIGGEGTSSIDDIIIASNKDVLITGNTSINNFPITPGVYQINKNSQIDAFVSRFSKNADSLIFSTFIGGSSNDFSNSISLTSNEDIIITGYTYSGDFPVTPGAYFNPNAALFRVFASKISQGGTNLLYSSIIGNVPSSAKVDHAICANEDIILVGRTYSSSNFPVTPGAYQTNPSGSYVGFVTRLNASGSALIYSTLLGGNDVDNIKSVELTTNEEVIVSGNTNSFNFPVTSGVYQSSYKDSFDVFVTRLNNTGTGLIYSTFLGGTGSDFNSSVSIMNNGNIAVTGETGSSDFPVTPGVLQENILGERDAFISVLSADLSSLISSTFLGGGKMDRSEDIFLIDQNKIVVSGNTSSLDFPTTTDAYQSNALDSNDAFISVLNLSLDSLSYSSYFGGSDHDYLYATAFNEGNIWAAGSSSSIDFPVTPGVFTTDIMNSNQHGFVVKFIDCIDNNLGINIQVASSNENVSNGSATVNFITQGTPPYTYQWDNNQTTQTVSNLSAGSYTVTVYDSNFCSVVDVGVINEILDTLDCSNAVSLICNTPYSGASSNAASQVYSYGCNTWSETGPERVHTYTPTENGPFSAKLINYTGDLDVYILGSCDPSDCIGEVLSDSAYFANGVAGTTYYLVVDADDGSGSAYDILVSGCANTNCDGFSVSLSGTNETGPSANDCAAVANITGGTSPFTYSWSNGATTDNISNVPAGTYGFTVTDGLNCSATDSITLELYTGIPCTELQTIITSTDLTDSIANDGTATAQGVGGNAPYTYAWSNNENTASIENLSPGLYTVTVTDANNCVNIENVVIYAPGVNPCNMSSIITSTNETADGANDGTVSVSPVNGVAPYSYVWNTGDSIAYLTNLNPDVYVVTITDSNNCSNVNVAVIEAYSDSIVSIKRNWQEQGLVVYPNPAKDFVNLVIKQPIKTPVNLEVLNSLGQIVLTQRLINNQQHVLLNVEALSKGTYYINYRVNELIKTAVFILNK